MKLRPYQVKAIDHIVSNPRSNLFVPMGMGKTVSTLTAIDILDLIEPTFPVLVVAPLRVANSTWPDEVRKWEHLRHLRVSVVTGTPASRRRALGTPADIYVTNFDNLTWLEETLGDEWPFRMIVVDECTKLKGYRATQGTKRARSLAKYAHKTPRYVGLTGTPATNGLIDLWGPLWFVDKGERLGRTFGAFRDRWFRSIQVGQDAFAVQLKPLAHAQTEIEDAIRDICLSFDPTDYFDLHEPIVSTVFVDLSTEARKVYDDMEKELFVEIEGQEVEAFSAAARTVKCLQIANGALYTDDGAWAEIHQAKLDALDEIVEESGGMPVLVAYQFKSDLARLEKRFPKGRVLDKDPATIDAWNRGEIPILFAHPASAGHGLNLQDGGNILAFFGLDWNLENRLQIIERIGPTRQAQAGHNRPVFIYNIAARRTLDEVVLKRIETKREVVDLLLEAMQEKKK